MMLDYKAVFVSDAAHNATLAIMVSVFADVRSTEETIDVLGTAPAARR